MQSAGFGQRVGSGGSALRFRVKGILVGFCCGFVRLFVGFRM